MPNGIDLRFDLPTDKELDAMFDAVPVLERHRVADQVVRAGARPIITRARQLAPRSSRTGSKKKWSANMYAGTAKSGSRSASEKPLWKTIKQVVRKGKRAGAISVVGPEWPEGNKAYFNTSPNGNVGRHWGIEGQKYPKKNGGFHTAGPAKARPQIRNWIVQAFDETKPQQLDAMKKKLQKLMDKVWKRG